MKHIDGGYYSHPSLCDPHTHTRAYLKVRDALPRGQRVVAEHRAHAGGRIDTDANERARVDEPREREATLPLLVRHLVLGAGVLLLFLLLLLEVLLFLLLLFLLLVADGLALELHLLLVLLASTQLVLLGLGRRAADLGGALFAAVLLLLGLVDLFVCSYGRGEGEGSRKQ